MAKLYSVNLFVTVEVEAENEDEAVEKGVHKLLTEAQYMTYDEVYGEVVNEYV